MKRSAIVNKLQEHMNNLAAGGQGYSANDIILAIESLGMAPPEVAEPCKTSVIVATPMGYQEQIVEDSVVFVRKWESE